MEKVGRSNLESFYCESVNLQLYFGAIKHMRQKKSLTLKNVKDYNEEVVKYEVKIVRKMEEIF